MLANKLSLTNMLVNIGLQDLDALVFEFKTLYLGANK